MDKLGFKIRKCSSKHYSENERVRQRLGKNLQDDISHRDCLLYTSDAADE